VTDTPGARQVVGALREPRPSSRVLSTTDGSGTRWVVLPPAVAPCLAPMGLAVATASGVGTAASVVGLAGTGEGSAAVGVGLAAPGVAIGTAAEATGAEAVTTCNCYSQIGLPESNH